ncbi:MAG TPA: RCC1 domain-containing protein [Rudaea sp.]|nr:RCC1 domain-containing protein [Rudaea sp.]
MRTWTCTLLVAIAPISSNAADAAIRQFDFGVAHRCAVTDAGAVQCLADSNVFGQVGDGSTGDQGQPRPVTVIARGASKVVTGSYFSCAIVGGALQCWGDIGDKPHNKPYTAIAEGVLDAAAGDDRVCAIVGDAIECIGAGARSGSVDYARLHPTPYTEIDHGARAIAVGHVHACAVVEDAVTCWGEVPFDPSERGERMTRTATPVRVIEHGATAIAAGSDHDCAIVTGALWCWGENTHGQVGIGADVLSAQSSPNLPVRETHVAKKTPRSAPRNDVFEDGAQRCSAPAGHVERCWVSRPARIVEHGAARVFAKDDDTCALIDDALKCWGANALGQLGTAAPGDWIAAPTTAIARGVTEVAVSGARTCALVEGALRCTRRCIVREGGPCRPDRPGFDARDLAFGLSDVEARVGVWRGTIGTQEVSLCLGRPMRDDARYYYVRHGRTLLLNADGADGTVWSERDGAATTGSWQLGTPQGNRLEGRWTSPDGAKNLPIELDRVRGVDAATLVCNRYDNGPGVVAWNAPRIAAMKRETSAPANGTRTVSVLGGQISIAEFATDNPLVHAFNAKMRHWLDDQIGEYFDCGEGAPANGSDFHSAREIELRADPWVVVRESYELSCVGAAHPSAGSSYETWNLDGGKRVEPWTWIRGSTLLCKDTPDCGYAVPTELNALILTKTSRNADGDECADAVNENTSYGLRPSGTGLTFSTEFAHVIQACDEDIELSYDELQPFLTDDGKTALKGLIEAAHREEQNGAAGSHG